MKGSKDKTGCIKQKLIKEQISHQNLKSLYEQLLHEVPKESHDPRRLNLLKNQVFMLERQCHGMTLQLNERQETLEHTYGTLEGASADMEQWLTRSSDDSLVINKTELNTVLKIIRGAARRLNKPSETLQTVTERQEMSNKFSGTVNSPKDIVTFNVKQMSNLEHKLSELAVSIERFKHSVSEQPAIKTKTDDISTSIRDYSSFRMEYDNLVSSLSKQLDDCCYDITQLSLLQPQLQLKKKKITKEITLDFVVEYLKKFTKKKEVFETIPIIWQLANHQAKVLKMRTVMLDGELHRCHQRLELHTKFVLEMLSGVEGMFHEFEKKSLVPLISEPLSNTIEAYQLLQNEQNNENFAEFFKRFDVLIPNLQNVLALLKESMKIRNSSELQNAFREEIIKFTKHCLLERKKSEELIFEENKVKEESTRNIELVLCDIPHDK